ncbi:hypothetical protein ACKYVA_21920, partial [Paenibacillus larvae]|uniref:hypothetical protein n=1 Tax=Paenibacillus larvae TaxID=1464 RepID=UPI00390800A7
MKHSSPDKWPYCKGRKKFLGPPFITQSRVVFLYLNVKNKKVIYMGVWIYMSFLIEKTILFPGC